MVLGLGLSASLLAGRIAKSTLTQLSPGPGQGSSFLVHGGPCKKVKF